MVCPHFGVCGGCRAYEQYSFSTYAQRAIESYIAQGAIESINLDSISQCRNAREAERSGNSLATSDTSFAKTCVENIKPYIAQGAIESINLDSISQCRNVRERSGDLFPTSDTYALDSAQSDGIVPLLFSSPQHSFRARADFRFCTIEGFYFATNAFGKNERTKITQCPILLAPIQILMKHIREIFEALSPSHPLRHKLYGCSFLSTYRACVITLIYHKPLESSTPDKKPTTYPHDTPQDSREEAMMWQHEARKLQETLTQILCASYADFQVQLIGRSKGQKVIIDSTPSHSANPRTSLDQVKPRDSLVDNFSVYLDENGRHLLAQNGIDLAKCAIIKKESLFSQPNPFINAKMLYFLLTTLPRIVPNIAQTDLLELYCGSGNFTIPLSQLFRRVFATEVVKDSIQILQDVICAHRIANITLARLNAQESVSALLGERAFFRLKDVDLGSFRFGAILIDPPRSGVGDEAMLEFIARFEVIVYISCAPQTLGRDLRVLGRTHRIRTLALFEQFPYTHHIESICILTR